MDLPSTFGDWKGVWKIFRRLSPLLFCLGITCALQTKVNKRSKHVFQIFLFVISLSLQLVQSNKNIAAPKKHVNQTFTNLMAKMSFSMVVPNTSQLWLQEFFAIAVIDLEPSGQCNDLKPGFEGQFQQGRLLENWDFLVAFRRNKLEQTLSVLHLSLSLFLRLLFSTNV